MVVLGRVLGPFGVQGWIKVAPFTEAPAALLEYDVWWLGSSATGQWQQATPVAGRVHADTMVATLAEVGDREAAAALKGRDIAVPRTALPAPAADEIYWNDLVGLLVVNREGVVLGRVQGVTAHAAHPLLQVREEGGTRERLIPYVPALIDAVDMEARRIDVDWGADY